MFLGKKTLKFNIKQNLKINFGQSYIITNLNSYLTIYFIYNIYYGRKFLYFKK